MRGLNKVFIMGNVGNDPEIKILETGTMTKFTVATNEKWTKDGETKEKTEWHNIVTFGKLAEICGEYLEKGSSVFLEGKIETRQYDKDGEKKYFTSILADNVQFLGGRKSNDVALPKEELTQAAFKAPTPAAAKKVKNYAPGADNSHLDDMGF